MSVQVEAKCCIELKGQTFCSGGAFVSEGAIVAYLDCDGKRITTWHGKTTISDKIRILSERQTNFGTGYYLRFEHKGFIYSGFCIGKGGIVKARKTKLKTLFD